MTRYADRVRRGPAAAMVAFILMAVILVGVPTPVRAVTVADLSPTQDARVTQNTTQNFAGETLLNIQSARANDEDEHTLMEWDLSTIPDDDILVTSATLSLHFLTIGEADAATDDAVCFYPVLESWIEASVHWFNASAGNPWDSPAWDTSVFDCQDVDDTVGFIDLDFSLVNVVQYWVDEGEDDNHGLRMKWRLDDAAGPGPPPDPPEPVMGFASQDNLTVADRPTLTIVYEIVERAPDYFGLGAALAAIITAMGFFNLILRPRKERRFEDVVFFLILVAILVIALGAWLASR